MVFQNKLIVAVDESLISTGVDNLIKLVYSRGRVKLQEAASALGIAPNVVEEWSKVLEEEGIIRVEYLLTGVFLVWAGTPTERAVERKELAEGKASIAREISAMLERLRAEGADIATARDELVHLPELLDQRLVTARVKAEKVKEIEKENERYRIQNIQAIEKLKDELERLKNQLYTAEAENKEFVSNTVGVNEQLAKLSAAIMELRKYAKETSEKIQKLEELGGKFTEIREEIAGHNQKLSRISGELKKAEETCSRLEQLKNSFTRSSREAETKIAELQKKCFENRQSMEETEARCSRESSKMKEEVGKLIEEAESLIARAGLKHKEKEVAELLNALSEAREEQQKLIQRLSMLSMEAKALPIKAAPEELEGIEEKTEKIKKKLVGVKKEEASYINKREELLGLIKKIGEEKPK